MKLQFKNQKYQEDAAKSVVDVFISQNNNQNKKLIDRIVKDKGTLFEEEVDVYSYGNNTINIDDSTLKQNIKAVQKENNLDITEDKNFDSKDRNFYNNFSIEMETGTGKTYTYIKTMYELNKAYGFSKFIVMVPSIAIREGTLKSFQITEEHFKEQYGKKIRYFVYNTGNSSNLASIKSFSEDSNINAIIMNYQAFNTKSKDSRKIYEELDELQSRKPIDIIKDTNPILILDEPQKMGNAEDLLKEFNPLFILRYSATHKSDRVYNLIYRIDAVDAYNKRLVKKIGVKCVELIDNKSISAYVYLEQVEIGNGEPRAHIEIEQKTKNGTRRVMKWVKRGDRLYNLSIGTNKEKIGLNAYKGYVVSEISFKEDTVATITFSNGVIVKTNQIIGANDENLIVTAQIRQTIISHFEKERTLFERGIKVLSLFFIDEVSKYRKYDENNIAVNGEYADIFEHEYNNIYKEELCKSLELDIEEYKDKEIDDIKKEIKNHRVSSYALYLLSLFDKKIHNGYFSIDKKKSKISKDECNEYYFIDSKISKIGDQKGESDDSDAFDLIMKDKERLLSFDEPVRFIFSHSALREGWDNPNVFQICTLKKNNSEISKRQEIGRGMRICVNQDGIRQDIDVLDSEFLAINKLTIIASESYDKFARSLQTEILSSLSRKSYTTMDDEHFINATLISNDKKDRFVFDKPAYKELHNMFLITYGYIDTNDNITQKLKEDISNDKLKIPEKYNKFSESYKKLIMKLYTDMRIHIDNDDSIKIPNNIKPNHNFMKKEFIELWNKINHITTYEVHFKSDELIDKAVVAINKDLQVSSVKIKITGAEQEEFTNIDSIKNGKLLKDQSSHTDYVGYDYYSTIRYDLVGDIAKGTELTRKTIALILKNIEKEKFAMFAISPEEFIQKTINIINGEKSATLVNCITYKKDGNKTYSNDIWTINSMNLKLGQGAIGTKKCVFDYLKYDSENEKIFAENLEKEDTVSVYAKLPLGFFINTPFGKYKPDWAISFDRKDVKYIYFIAETKGSISSLELRPTEGAKIECAKKHFNLLFDKDVNIGFEKVDSFKNLLDVIKG